MDIIFTISNFIAKAGVGNINLSDHELIFCVRKKVKKKRNSVNFIGRSYCSYNGDIFAREFCDCDWNDFENCEDPEILWQIYKNDIRKILDQMCPLKTFTISKDRDPWILDELINEIKHKDYLLKKAKKSKNRNHWIEARQARNACLRHVRTAKSEFIKKELKSNKNDRTFWQGIRSVILDRITSSNQFFLNDEDDIEAPCEETSNYINNFFGSIGPNLARKFNEEWVYHGD